MKQSVSRDGAKLSEVLGNIFSGIVVALVRVAVCVALVALIFNMIH